MLIVVLCLCVTIICVLVGSVAIIALRDAPDMQSRQLWMYPFLAVSLVGQMICIFGIYIGDDIFMVVSGFIPDPLIIYCYLYSEYYLRYQYIRQLFTQLHPYRQVREKALFIALFFYLLQMFTSSYYTAQQWFLMSLTLIVVCVHGVLLYNLVDLHRIKSEFITVGCALCVSVVARLTYLYGDMDGLAILGIVIAFITGASFIYPVLDLRSLHENGHSGISNLEQSRIQIDPRMREYIIRYAQASRDVDAAYRLASGSEHSEFISRFSTSVFYLQYMES